MMDKGVNRSSTIYVQGGGLLLDMCGFACSIYMRGIKNVVYVPTTLLAIVDATVGGKTGINWNGAKNMLGITKHAK
jgi:3-dehydroquinate synthase